MRDILLDPDTGDLKIENGDFAFGDPTTDNQRLLLAVEKGELKYDPINTVGIRSYLMEEYPGDMLREVTRVMAKDGMRIRNITYRSGRLNIDAHYD